MEQAGGMKKDARCGRPLEAKRRKHTPSRLFSLTALLLRALNASLRYRIHVPLTTRGLFRSGKPCLLAFWHSRILLLPFLYRSRFPGDRHLLTLVGPHWNRSVVSRTLARVGLVPFRMASLMGGEQALEKTIRSLRAGDAIAIAPDSAEGPPGQIGSDILRLARATGTPIVPVSWSARPRWRTSGWDRLQVPAPFARVHVAFGEPLCLTEEENPGSIAHCRRLLDRQLTGLAGRTDEEAREARIAGWMFWGYNALLVVASLLILPWLLWKIATVRNRRTGFTGRLGLTVRPQRGEEGRQRPLWIHTVSVGEVLSTVPFVLRLKEVFPDLPRVVSSITPAGRTMAERTFRDGERITFFPFDYPLPIRRTLRGIRPRLLLLTETEIWPNFLLMLGREGIPSAIVNGRISEGSCRRFGWFRFFLKRVLSSVCVFAMQSRTDCLRIIRIGADPGRVHLTGNMKFDVPLPADSQEERHAVRQEMGFAEDSLVLVGGSTHDGEERILLGVYRELKRETANLKLLLAPRHPERCADLERMCEKERLSSERRTRNRGRAGLEGIGVLLLDTMGELAHAYAAADVVFVGGSLVPIGGHNPLEPILYKKPVLLGPHTEKIRDIVRTLLDAGGAIVVQGREGLRDEVRRLLADPAYREAVGRAAHGILEAHRGAVERNLAILRPFLYPDDLDQNPRMA